MQVLRDFNAMGVPDPRVEDKDWTDDPRVSSVFLWSADGTGRGISVDLTISGAEQIAWVADQVQEWAVEGLWLGKSNWPPCPDHPNNHPLTPDVVDETPRWVCPTNARPFAIVGEWSAGNS